MTKFPAPQQGDPDFVFENAMFLALADPAARHILELLRREACSLDEIAGQVGGRSAAYRWLDNLKATNLVAQDAVSHVYSVDRVGFERFRDWVDRFLTASLRG